MLPGARASRRATVRAKYAAGRTSVAAGDGVSKVRHPAHKHRGGRRRVRVGFVGGGRVVWARHDVDSLGSRAGGGNE
jgi:hypothetical protein